MTTGTEGNDNLTNNRAINFETVDALGGDDVITIVTPSNDLTRVDVLGGAGNDTMRISALQFRSADGSGTAGTVLVREGSRNYTVTYNSVERLELTGGLFGPSVNFVTGASTDILRLSTTFQNAVTISTNEGDDEIYFQAQNPGSGGSVSIDAGAGNDLIDFTAVTGAGPTTFGNGGEGHDALVGSGFADRLLGGSGDDSLDGRAGTDTLEGGTGNDLYFVDTTGDAVIELANEGEADEVRTALGSAVDYAALYVLPDNVEKLTGTSPAAQGVRGNALNNAIAMGGGNDLIVLDDGGDDAVTAGGGNDFIYYGAAWSAADRTDGGEGTDTIGLLGSYDVTLTAETLTSVERLALYTGLATSGGTANNYKLTTVDATVAAGAELFVTAASLKAGETLIFNGSAETDGRFTIVAGAGNDILAGGRMNDYLAGGAGDDQLFGLDGRDTLFGGLGADLLRGGAGKDVFRYQSLEESTREAPDRIADFSVFGERDLIDLSAVDAEQGIEGNQAFRFIGVNAEFSRAAGELRVVETGGKWFVEGDVNGDGIADLVIHIVNGGSHIFSGSDFLL